MDRVKYGNKKFIFLFFMLCNLPLLLFLFFILFSPENFRFLFSSIKEYFSGHIVLKKQDMPRFSELVTYIISTCSIVTSGVFSYILYRLSKQNSSITNFNQCKDILNEINEISSASEELFYQLSMEIDHFGKAYIKFKYDLDFLPKEPHYFNNFYRLISRITQYIDEIDIQNIKEINDAYIYLCNICNEDNEDKEKLFSNITDKFFNYNFNEYIDSFEDALATFPLEESTSFSIEDFLSDSYLETFNKLKNISDKDKLVEKFFIGNKKFEQKVYTYLEKN